LRRDFASSKFFLEEFFQFFILFDDSWQLRCVKRIFRNIERLRLRFAMHLVKLSGVLITISDSNRSAANQNVWADHEVHGIEGHLRTVLSQDHLSFQKRALRSTTIDLLWFRDHHASIFQEVIEYQLSYSEVLKTRFDNAFLKVTEKSEDLHQITITHFRNLPVYRASRK
jgi:hypothetical protein